MTDALNGQNLNAGAASPPLVWSFTRPSGDTTTNYLNAAIRLLVFPASGIKQNSVPSDPDDATVTLTIGSGLTRSTNLEATQAGTIQFTKTQLETLLGTANRVLCRYQWRVHPSGALEFASFIGTDDSDYNGYFSVIRTGFAGMDPATVKN